MVNGNLQDSKNRGLISRILIKLRPTPKTAPYYFIGPTFILFLTFMLYPILYSFILSFQKFNAGSYEFVGLKNYFKLINDPVFRKALVNTVIYLIIQVPFMIFLSLITANFLNNKFLKYKKIFKISYFLPAVTSLVAYSLIFKLLLNTDFGFVNYILSFFSIPQIDWLNSPIAAKLSVILAITWRWTGYNMIIMLAGLQNIPKEIYEASDIDGASPIQKFFRITLPMMKPIILFCTITSTIGTFKLFDESYILTGGGPNNATITVVHYLYNNGFRYLKFGYASAMSYLLVLFIVAFSFLQFKFTGGMGDE
ncbi:carbohydrate ABC transporter membrane protein 1, CUT1 family [Halanaerobium kushneri]|uniref:Carbohydrate ABC transporter membrane protein 1, CUT1 family n=1 Tax=Halanaerobium kushneri TaxID=56779 RepID=A0A1N6RY80_9FIRM|nr:sugar ABC transporter permease [Halanaerobium kushneri]SIQ33808.1 carbohydrate ABC transporter membrane protein 1, CUT1 family [Halanaerobium kushneri]